MLNVQHRRKEIRMAKGKKIEWKDAPIGVLLCASTCESYSVKIEEEFDV